MGGLDVHSDGRDGPPSFGVVVRVAGERWGVVSRAELRAWGLSAATVDNWLRRGRLTSVYRRVYAVGHRVLRPEGWRLAAVLACGPGAVLSHLSAAKHLGLLHTDQERTDVTARRSRERVPGIRLHRSRSLDARYTTTHEGIPVTTVARTLLDVAATHPRRLERALAQAERLRLYDHNAIRGVIERTNGHRGRAVLKRATEREPQLTRSELEAKVLATIRAAGLPEPKANTLLTALDHQRYEVDLYWPAHHLIVELDGYETHGTRRAFEADRRRDAALTATGYRVMRFTWRTPPGEIVDRLRSLLRHH